MRPLGVIRSAYDEFLRAVRTGRLAGIAAEGNLLERFLAGSGKFVGVALLNLAVLIYLALPEARQYFETKESAPPIPA